MKKNNTSPRPSTWQKTKSVIDKLARGIGYVALAALPVAGGTAAYMSQQPEQKGETPDAGIETLSVSDSQRCAMNMRTTFNNQTRQVNMTGETGVGMGVSYGYDQNCKQFTLRFYDNFHAMLGRHDVLMNDAYQSAAYRHQLDGFRYEIASEPKRYDMDTREGRMEILQLVNTRVNGMFHYQKDSQVFYRSNYFASPIESMAATHGGAMTGDCDDYAGTKYIILRDLGFDTNMMFMSVVSRIEVNATNHAVLMVNAEGGHPAQPRYQVLDNDAAAEIVDSMASGYKTYMAFNGSGSYIFPHALQAAGEIDLRYLSPKDPYVKAPPAQERADVKARLS